MGLIKILVECKISIVQGHGSQHSSQAYYSRTCMCHSTFLIVLYNRMIGKKKKSWKDFAFYPLALSKSTQCKATAQDRCSFSFTRPHQFKCSSLTGIFMY